MSESNEKLSVIIDEYADDDVCQKVLDDVIDDVNLQYQMRRYQMIGDVMRHELPDRINLDLSHQIMSEVRKIDSQESVQAQPGQTSSGSQPLWGWVKLKPFAGLAVAASVALVSVTLWQSEPVNSRQVATAENKTVSVESRKMENFANLPPQINAITVSSGLKEGTRWLASEDSPALQQKLNGYLVNHTEYAIPMQGLIPQARVAGFDSEQ
jgi:negative regulator of sigma E activity